LLSAEPKKSEIVIGEIVRWRDSEKLFSQRGKEEKRERGKEKIIGETMSSSIPVILYRIR